MLQNKTRGISPMDNASAAHYKTQTVKKENKFYKVPLH